MRLTVKIILSAVLSLCLLSVGQAEENAVHAKCEINVRLVQAIYGNKAKSVESKNNVNPSLTADEHQQLEGLPFGSYYTLDMKTAKTSSFTPVVFELLAGDAKAKEFFTVTVTPNSLADNKVHYTLEWSTPNEKSMVATRLGVENGRSVMVGADLSAELGKKKSKNSRCFIVGVKVTCHG